MAKIDSKGKQDGSWQWNLQRTNEKILEAIADFNSGTKRVSLVHNGSLDLLQKSFDATIKGFVLILALLFLSWKH